MASDCDSNGDDNGGSNDDDCDGDGTDHDGGYTDGSDNGEIVMVMEGW